MDRKKAIVISLAVSFVVVTALFCYFYFQGSSKNNNKVVIPSENTSKLSVKPSLPIPVVAEESIKKDYYVKDTKDTSEIKKSFDEYVGAQASSDQKGKIAWSRIVNEGKEEASVDDFSNAVGIKVDEKINNLLKKNDYDLITCYSDNGSKDYGMVLTVKLFKDYPNSYLDEVDFMKKWEGRILNDFHNALFPGTNFSQSELEKSIEFKDGKFHYRYAEVRSGLFVYYLIIDDYVIIASSELCVDKAAIGLVGG